MLLILIGQIISLILVLVIFVLFLRNKNGECYESDEAIGVGDGAGVGDYVQLGPCPAGTPAYTPDLTQACQQCLNTNSPGYDSNNYFSKSVGCGNIYNTGGYSPEQGERVAMNYNQCGNPPECQLAYN